MPSYQESFRKRSDFKDDFEDIGDVCESETDSSGDGDAGAVSTSRRGHEYMTSGAKKRTLRESQVKPAKKRKSARCAEEPKELTEACKRGAGGRSDSWRHCHRFGYRVLTRS